MTVRKVTKQKGEATRRYQVIVFSFLFPPRWSALSSHRCLLFTESAFLLSWLATFCLLNAPAEFMNGELVMARGLVFSSFIAFNMVFPLNQMFANTRVARYALAAKHQWKDRGVFAWRIELKGWYQRLWHVNPVAHLKMTLSSLSGPDEAF